MENLDSAVQKNALKLVMVVSQLKRSSEVSPEFPTPQMPDVTWKLKVYTPCVTPRREDIAVYLVPTGVKEGHSMKVHSALSICDEASKVVLGKFDATMMVDHVNAEYYLGYFKRDKAVRLEADISILGAGGEGGLSITSTATSGDHQRPAKRKRVETEDEGNEIQKRWWVKFSELYGDQASSDCRIEIGDVSIPAHKSILIPHSPIFRRMFTNPLAEEFQSGTIKIAEFDEPEPMRALIRYCYYGHLDDATMDGKLGVETFKLADRYCVAGLKAYLEQHFVVKKLSVENVVWMADLADTYTAPELKEACLKLIAKEWETVFECANWKKLEEVRPRFTTHIAVEAFRALHKKG